jgi:hypothetical protein
MRRELVFLALALSILLGSSSASKANTVTVAQCSVSEPCFSYVSPLSINKFITPQELAFLGLGKSVSLVATQLSGNIMRLGQTTITFYDVSPGGGGPGATIGPPVTEVIAGEFNGGFHPSCGVVGVCETDTLGSFFIPLDATSAQIFSTFGNSQWPNSAAMRLDLQSVSVPGPVMGAGFPGALLGGAVLVAWWRRKQRAQVVG